MQSVAGAVRVFPGTFLRLHPAYRRTGRTPLRAVPCDGRGGLLGLLVGLLLGGVVVVQFREKR